MRKLWEKLIEFLSSLFGGGNKAAKLNEMEALLRTLNDNLRIVSDSIYSLKREIAEIETKLVAKKHEFDEARGDTQGIIKGEILRLNKNREGLAQRRDLIFEKQRRLDVQIEQVKIIIDALRNKGLSESEIDKLILELRLQREIHEREGVAIDDLAAEQIMRESADKQAEKEVVIEEDEDKKIELSPELVKLIEEMEKPNEKTPVKQ